MFPYRQGCRICVSVSALLPGTFYFARHFLCVTQNNPKWQKMTQNGKKKWPKMAKKNDPKWPKNWHQLKKIAQIYLQHLPPFCISDHHQPMVFRLKRIFSYFYPSFTISCVFEFSSYCNGGQFDVKILPDKCIFSSIFDEIKYLYDLKKRRHDGFETKYKNERTDKCFHKI